MLKKKPLKTQIKSALCALIFTTFVAGQSYAGDLELLTAAYKTVDTQYLGDVSAGQFAAWSIYGLQDMDKNVRVANESGHVTIYYKSKPYRSFVVPKDEHDALAWAKLARKAIKDMRKISPLIKSKDFEAPDRLLKAGIKKLDKASQYYSNLLKEEPKKAPFSRDYAERMLDNNILYMKIGTFNQYTRSSIVRSLNDNSNIKGIIIDLRMSPGGMLSEALAVADLFLDSGIIVSTKGRLSNSAVYYRANDKAMIKNVPIVVIVDGGTASAAEVIAAALKEQGLAAIIGTRTIGKGTVQNIVNLPDNNQMLLTNAYYFTPSGAEINNIGLTPDICLYRAKEHASAETIIEQKEPENCPQENRADRKIDEDVAIELINRSLNLY